MERLTDKDLLQTIYDPWELCGMDGVCTKGCHDEDGCTKGCYILKMYHKLADYEDLEEQGKLIKLPCKVGDTVYIIKNDEIIKDKVEDCDIWSIRDGIKLRIQLQHYNDYVFGELGKTVFLDRKEAEAVLEEMFEGNEI